MNYDDMPAGPELDRLVAEKVMGWSLLVCVGDTKPNGVGLYRTPNGNRQVHPHLGDDEPICFRPSSNIAHAFAAVGVLHSKGFSFSISDDAEPIPDKPWPWGYKVTFGDFESESTSVCEALCRAALKAVAK